MRIKCSARFSLCVKIFSSTMVIPRTWIRKEVVFCWWIQSTRMMLTFAESKHPVFWSTSPLSRGVPKSKGGGKLSIHYCADPGTIETVFRKTSSVNHLSIYGAVSDLCDEYSACQARTERPALAGQADPLVEPARLLITTPAPSIEITALENKLPKVQRTSDMLSQQDLLIKICTDAGFLTTVEVGQYFMTKDTE